jgi:hypothetical protein
MIITTRFLFTLPLLAASASASAWWGNDGWNCWPVWTPMYWMEEVFDDNDYRGYGPYGYGVPYGGYGYDPYGHPAGGYYPYPDYGFPATGYGYPWVR